jgi:transcriptional regulator with XRE-family HTH domain
MGLGKQIEHYRKKAGLTYEELEEWSGVASGTINALEKRDSSRSEKFPALARSFGLTLEQLADETKSYVIRLQRHDQLIPMSAAEPYTVSEFDTPSFSRGPANEVRSHDDNLAQWGSFGTSERGIAQRVADKLLGRPAHGMQPILAWEHEDDLPPGEYVMVPRLSVNLSAGGGRDQIAIEFEELQPQAFRADWIRKKRLKPAKLASMTETRSSSTRPKSRSSTARFTRCGTTAANG